MSTTRNREDDLVPAVQVTPVRAGAPLSLPCHDGTFGYKRQAAPSEGLYIETADQQGIFLSATFLRAALEHLSTLPELPRKIAPSAPPPDAARSKKPPSPEELWFTADRNIERYIALLLEHRHLKETAP